MSLKHCETSSDFSISGHSSISSFAQIVIDYLIKQMSLLTYFLTLTYALYAMQSNGHASLFNSKVTVEEIQVANMAWTSSLVHRLIYSL